ncbi:anti-sigma factor [Blastopirellula sp. J2-11]|uniref:anti-sigma factor n=1 Tax=Blastopirellula sp. J2-11 TaxID=2943192 RepID=UPI0021C9BB63|nr:anti-sigma factor [Blastopirellula sp. J2-11]UUO05629.1 anti-sigma factor [Blastopirellula sp. J2-11]
MDCTEARERLSDYFDGEMPAEQQQAMTDHLADCESCALELADYEDLSALTASLDHPLPPAGLWGEIESQLQTEDSLSPESLATAQPFRWTTGRYVPLVMALAASVVFAIGWFGYQSNLRTIGNLAIATVFDQYFDTLHQDPVAAQQILLTKYEGQTVDAEHAVHLVGYRPAVADGVPEGYSLHTTNVIKMPQGDCVHTQFQRADGSTLAIFEHDGERPAWFGKRAATQAVHGERKLNVVDLDQRVAATWREGDRHLTVVGAHNAEELGQLAGWFGKRTNLLRE